MMSKFSSGALVRPEPWGPLSRARGQACRGGEAERGGVRRKRRGSASVSCGQGAARGAAPVASRRRVVAERRGRGRKRKGPPVAARVTFSLA